MTAIVEDCWSTPVPCAGVDTIQKVNGSPLISDPVRTIERLLSSFTDTLPGPVATGGM
jgi:hypothetical protein